MAVGHRYSALAAQVLTAAPGMIQDVACDAAAAAAAAAVPVVLAEAASVAAAAAEAAAVIGSGAQTAAVLRQHRYAPDMEQNAAGDAVQLAGTGAFHTALGHAELGCWAAAAAAAGDAAAAAADDDAAAAAVAAAVPGAGEAKGRRHKHVHSHQEVQILALQRHCPVQLGCLAPQAAVMVEGGSLA